MDTLDKYTPVIQNGYYNFNFNSSFSDEPTGRSAKLSLDYKVSENLEIIPDMFSYRNNDNITNINNLIDCLKYSFVLSNNITSENATVDIKIGAGVSSRLTFNSDFKYADNRKIQFVNQINDKDLELKNGNKIRYYKRIYGDENNKYEYVYAYSNLNEFIDFVFVLSGQKNEEYSEDVLKELLNFSYIITDYKKTN